jgi:hypothetical protein
VTCQVDIDWDLRGSVRRGDVQTRCLGVRSSVSLRSEAADDEVAALLKLAKQGCFLEQLIVQATPVVSSLVLNGRTLEA